MPRFSLLLPVVAASFMGTAVAQTLPDTATRGAQGTVVAPPSYRSPLEGYRPYVDESVTSWKEANENVGRIGGWREYARESQQAAPGSPSPSAPPTRAPQGGHHQH
jgi:hypothetical protein